MQSFYVRVQQTLTGPTLLLSAVSAVSAGSAALTSSMESHFLFSFNSFQTSDFLFLQEKIRHLY